MTLPIKESSETVFLPVDLVLWIESANKYAILHTAKRAFVVRRTIESLLEQLKSESFLRIHRTAVIRKGAIWSVRPLHHGDQIVVLTDGTVLTLSRTYRAAFFAEIQQSSRMTDSNQPSSPYKPIPRSASWREQ